MEYNIHEVEWTDVKVSRFWNYFSKNKKLTYFTQDVGSEVIRLAQKHISLDGNMLDYGTGNGFLIEYLLKKETGIISGVDFSEDSVHFVNQKYRGQKNFGGCSLLQQLPSSLKNNFYDIVFFIETIEHLLNSYFKPTLLEINRVTKKGGFVVITTRNDEDIEREKVLCPDCGAVYHRVQHIRKFTINSITELMNDFGFAPVYCDSLHLSRNKFPESLLWKIYRMLKKPSPKNPNLIYVGVKERNLL